MRLLKLGGTSVATTSRRDAVAALVEAARQREPVVVVTSALAGVTDQLLAAIDGAIGGEDPPRRTARVQRLRRQHLEGLPSEPASATPDATHQTRADIETHLAQLVRCLDGIALLADCPATTRHRVLALGERMALPLVTAALRRRGLDALGVDSAQLLVTESADGPNSAEPAVDMEASRDRVRHWYRALAGDQVPVVTGFVAADAEGRTTTLGRGASDLTATLLGAFLEADGVEIWTDVDGVLSASPHWVEAPLRLPRLSYAEAAEMAHFGARVLHPRTLQPLLSTSIPVCIRNSLQPLEEGTCIGPDSEEPQHTSGGGGSFGVRAISARTGNVLLRLSGDGFSVGRALYGVLESMDIEPLMLVHGSGGSSLSLVVTAELTEGALRQLRRRLDASRHPLSLEVRRQVSVVAVLGAAIEPTRVAARVLEALRDEAIESLALSLPCLSGHSGEYAVAVLVDDAEVPRAVRRLHHDLVTASPTSPPQGAPLRRAQSRQEPLMRLL